MNSRHKNLWPVAVIVLIGLAGSSVAFAQRPLPAKPSAAAVVNLPVRPLACARGETLFKVENGTDDNFASTGTADPVPHPAGIPGLNSATNIYDQTANNYHFGDTFQLNQPGQITRVRVTTRLKGNTEQPGNDGISFSTTTSFASGHISYGLPSWTVGQIKLFWFDFTAGSPIQVNGVSVPAVIVPGNFYSNLNMSQKLHVYVQDDTSVDFVQIEGCYKPTPPKYDLSAAKKHDGNVYSLNVHNNGGQIMPTGHVDVIEVVPAGLIVYGASGTSWQCPGVNFPVNGPDAFTCTYQVPAGGIAAGGNLPPIFLKTEGKPECPNCMRVKLYLKDVSGGQKPVEEADNNNNASCTK